MKLLNLNNDLVSPTFAPPISRSEYSLAKEMNKENPVTTETYTSLGFLVATETISSDFTCSRFSGKFDSSDTFTFYGPGGNFGKQNLDIEFESPQEESKEEFGIKGDYIYNKLKSFLEKKHFGKFVVIDVVNEKIIAIESNAAEAMMKAQKITKEQCYLKQVGIDATVS